jgi:hypothetical protein
MELYSHWHYSRGRGRRPSNIGPGPVAARNLPDQRGGVIALQPQEQPNPASMTEPTPPPSQTEHSLLRTALQWSLTVCTVPVDSGGGKTTHMYRLLACLALALLLGYASIGNATAGAGTVHEASNHYRNGQPGSSHTASSRRHARGPDHNKGTYRSQLRDARSEWRQARYSGNKPAATGRGG